MDTTAPTPMVNSALLRRYQGRRVRSVLKIVGRTNDGVQCLASDNGTVLVKPSGGAHYESPFVEVIGVVENETTIREEEFTNFGENFDMGTYNQLVNLSNGEQTHLFL